MTRESPSVPEAGRLRDQNFRDWGHRRFSGQRTGRWSSSRPSQREWIIRWSETGIRRMILTAQVMWWGTVSIPKTTSQGHAVRLSGGMVTLPWIWGRWAATVKHWLSTTSDRLLGRVYLTRYRRSEEHTSELQSRGHPVRR